MSKNKPSGSDRSDRSSQADSGKNESGAADGYGYQNHFQSNYFNTTDNNGNYKSNGKTGGRKSLVRRITTYQILQNLSLTLFINFNIALIFSCILVFQVCNAASAVYRSRSMNLTVLEGAPAVTYPMFDGCRVEEVREMPSRLRLPRSITGLLGLPDGTAVWLRFQKISDISFTKPWANVYSDFTMPVRESPQELYYFVEFSHHNLFFYLWLGTCVLLVLEIISVVKRMFRINYTTKKMLQPIMDLTRAAQSMNAEPGLKLSAAIATLNTITEQHLDKRISIEDERVELKGLAGAINSMLDRLDLAYQAQLRFVSDASHELRTPISVIQGYANLLDRWGKKDEKTLQESIDAIKNEADSMKDMVEQLLFLARSDNHSITISMENFDYAQLAEEVCRETKMIDETHAFSANIQPDLPVYGDFPLMKQALRIFIDNSIKYTPEGGSISITAKNSEKSKGYIEVAVSDTGIGIPEDALPFIFDRFFRADKSRTRKSGGTGLGLSIAKWIIDSHKGYVEIISRKDVGTKFTIFFPRSAAAPTPNQSANPGASAGTSSSTNQNVQPPTNPSE